MDNINEIPKALSDLLTEMEVTNEKGKKEKNFKKVLRGFPEKSVNTYTGDIAVVYLNKIDSENNFDTNILPTELKMTLGIVCKGTKTAVHDKIIENSLAVFEKLEENNDWRTIKGLATGILVEDFNIYPEQKGKSLLTTAVFDLRIGLPDLSKELEEKKLNVKLNVIDSDENG